MTYLAKINQEWLEKFNDNLKKSIKDNEIIVDYYCDLAEKYVIEKDPDVLMIDCERHVPHLANLSVLRCDFYEAYLLIIFNMGLIHGKTIFSQLNAEYLLFDYFYLCLKVNIINVHIKNIIQKIIDDDNTIGIWQGDFFSDTFVQYYNLLEFPENENLSGSYIGVRIKDGVSGKAN
jgi:hypothetical protein